MKAVQVSPWELLETVNKARAELRRIIDQYFDPPNFDVPDRAKVTEDDVLGWPVEFDELIIDYCVHSLSGLSAEIKAHWIQRVVRQAESMDKRIHIVRGYYYD